MQNRQIILLFIVFAITLGVYGRAITKDTLTTEVAQLKKIIEDALQKLHDNGLEAEGETLKQYERDVSVVEKHIEQAGDDIMATKSASIVLGGLTKKIHDEVKRCEHLEHKSHDG